MSLPNGRKPRVGLSGIEVEFPVGHGAELTALVAWELAHLVPLK